MNITSLAFFTFVGIAASLCAVEPPKPSEKVSSPGEEWITRSFRFAPDIQSRLSLPDEKPSEPPLDPPSADANEQKWIEHIQKTTLRMEKVLAMDGINLPVGTAFALDASAQTLAVRTSLEGMELLNFWTRHEIPSNLIFHLHIVQADAAEIRRIVAETSTLADHTAQWLRLKELAEKGQARLLHTLRIETRSGQRASVESGKQHTHANGLEIDDKGGIVFEWQQRMAGVRFEIDPALGPDGKTVDIDYSLEHHLAAPTERSETVSDVGKLGRIEVPMTDFHCAKLTTLITTVDGATKLLGVWKPQGNAELEKASVLEAAFLRADVVLDLHLENKTLLTMLRRFGDKALPRPAENLENMTHVLPEGMKRKAFSVPPSFLAHAAAQSERSEKQETISSDTIASPISETERQNARAKNIFTSVDIPFPEEASVSLNARASMIMVVNTPEQLDAIDIFLDGGCYRLIRAIVPTLQIIQADGAILRKITEETSTLADHGEALRKLEELAVQGKAKVITTMLMETRSGQHGHIETVTERMGLTEFSKSDANGEMNATLESKPVGTNLEIDSVLGPGGFTMDVTYALTHHYAPPSVRKQGGGGEDKTRRVEIATTDFHVVKLNSQMMLQKGMTRLIGLWKLEGTPEFDSKDLMQAAFLRVDMMPCTYEEIVSQRK